MGLRVWFLAVALFVAADGQTVNLNNVDVDEPIVRRSPAADTDLFGYSVVLHQIEPLQAGDDVETALGKTLVVVGAPRGTFPGGLPYTDQGNNADPETGLVYQCPLLPGSCDGVRGNTSLYSPLPGDDNDIPEGRLFDEYPTANIILFLTLPILENLERKSGQLMGATLFSNGETFIACAPRWSYTPDEPQPRGRCYTSGRSLTGFRLLFPCHSLNDGNEDSTARESHCMAGTGVTALDNNGVITYAIGAPGRTTYSGAVYYKSADEFPDLAPEDVVSMPDMDPYTMGPVFPDTGVFQGTQVTTGFITRARGPSVVPNVVAAVPRYRGTAGTYTGRVAAYDVDSPGTVLSEVDVEGLQVAEFFGYSLLAADLTGDGYDELIVGAPMYSDVAGGRIEMGRVFVFENTGGSLSGATEIILGTVDRGRFGNSLASLGDVDDDGYDDIVIGSPYLCNSADCSNTSTGAVYIYYGRQSLSAFVEQTPFVILAETVVTAVDGLDSLASFGFSVAGGVDVDGNSYYDLVVGAYQSKTAVIFRSFPVARVTFNFPEIQPVDLDSLDNRCEYDGEMYSCFNLTFIAEYTGRGLDGSLSINYTLSEELVGDEQRIFFEDNGLGSISTTRMVEFPSPDTSVNVVVLVLVRQNLENTLDFLWLQITIPTELPKPDEMTDGNQTVTDLIDFPRLRIAGNTSLSVQLVASCGEDLVCDADMVLEEPTVTYLATDDEGNSVDTMNFVVGETERIQLVFGYSNRGPDFAPRPSVRFQLSGLASSVVGTALIDGCDLDGGVYDCALGDSSFLPANEPGTITITLPVNDQDELLAALQTGSAQFSITFMASIFASDLSNETDPSNNNQTVQFSAIGRADIFVDVTFPEPTVLYSGSGISVAAIDSTADLGGVGTIAEVTIGNNGPTLVPSAVVNIYYPGLPVAGDVNGPYYLYPSLLRILPSSEVDRVNCSSVAQVDPLSIGPESSNRRRRSVMSSEMREMRRAALRGRKRVRQSEGGATVDCQSDQDRCLLLTCIVEGLGATRAHDIIFRIDGVVDERAYADQSGAFSFIAYAVAEIPSSSVLQPETAGQLDNNQDTGQLTVSPPPDESEDDVEVWRLVISIVLPTLGAIGLLTFLVIVLVRFGFFRRKKAADLAEGDFDVNKFSVEEVPPESKEATAL